jgi:hypothetical protein
MVFGAALNYSEAATPTEVQPPTGWRPLLSQGVLLSDVASLGLHNQLELVGLK